ncbi:KRI1-like family C-terminal-domain-containing protein [Staphylotrichum tortipilum]|uniref:KRI1-like family C-terminal-domain-containing protein n=1 Tax=Staphylotrichum tortipilum TaxID=2831512 RepID=A0AAN6ME17_9PEZI|nr:KRI1-like family C-terminal-domain-containing protein [Staphylotrichum longicolle]
MASASARGAHATRGGSVGTSTSTSTSKPVQKKALFDDSGSSSEDDQEDGGATLGPAPQAQLKINEEYARRFEHNKKREDLHRLQEKYGPGAGGANEESESSSDDESEDDDAALVTEDLDAEISATLQAIKNKDPRIYDKEAVFYTPFDPTAEPKKKEEKPMFLRDYHRERYLSGDVGADDDNTAAASTAAVPRTYVQEQDHIKQSILSEINAAAAAADDEEEWSDDDAFIKPVKKADVPPQGGIHPSRAPQINLKDLDVANADKNPEDYLSKFMAAKAWAPEGAGSKWQAFESDDGEDADDMADEFEHAYNMRFEDPTKSNEFLKTYSRNMAAARSARKEELTGRKKQRALEKERKEAEKKERDADRARLRRLKVEEASDRLAKIKTAAGMSGKNLTDEQWIEFLDDAWEDDQWEEEMKKRFGDEYYAEADDLSMGEDENEDGDAADGKKKKPKKPKWDDDIDINDIIPDFEDDTNPAITLTDDEDAQEAPAQEGEEDSDDDERPAKKRKTTKDIKKDRIAAKRQARADLAKIEALVDTKMELDNPRAIKASGSGTGGGGFRYRETSPTSFGLTARDILLAPSDAALNEFAGLKKLATFRDAEKKRKDKKRLGKKARLREWRRETFGRRFEQTGPTYGFEGLLGEGASAGGTGANAQAVPVRREKKKGGEGGEAAANGGVVDGERKKKRKRSKNKGKKAAGEGEE